MGQKIKNSKKFFYSNELFYIHKTSNIKDFFFISQGLIYKNKNNFFFSFWGNLKQTIKFQKIVIYSANLCFSSSRRFSYCSRPYWRFVSFSSSERFLYCSWPYWRLLSFSSSERFWYFPRAFFESLSLFSFVIIIFHFYI